MGSQFFWLALWKYFLECPVSDRIKNMGFFFTDILERKKSRYLWNHWTFWKHVRIVTRLTWRVSLVEQELLTLPEHLSSPLVFSGVRVTQSLVFYVCFVDVCTFSFGHCVVCSSWIYRFWIPLWYLQTLFPPMVLYKLYFVFFIRNPRLPSLSKKPVSKLLSKIFKCTSTSLHTDGTFS